MTEVEKAQSNLLQLPIRGNYRDVAAQDMTKVYSRNIAHRKLPLSYFAQKAFKRTIVLERTEEGHPISSGNDGQLETTSFDVEFRGLKPKGRPFKILEKSEKADVLQKDKIL